MFVSTPFVILAFTAVGRVASETYKKGDKAVLSPGSVSDPITSITWKHGPDIAVDWYGQNKTEYRDFKGRCEVNTNTGALTIINLSLKDSGSYTAEINHKIMKTTEIKVITAVPKPTIKKQCNSEVTQCTLTCNASITADMGTITYSWKAGDSQIQAESPSNQLIITKDDTESVGKLISCQLENPVSSERSKDIMSPFTNESSVGGIAAAVVIVLAVAVLVGICWHKRRPGNADQSWGQYLAHNLRSCLNCGRTNRQTRQQNHREQQEMKTLMSENGDATSPASQTVPNQDQAKPVSTGTANGAEKPESTLKIENETRSDQTPAESTDPISEAATSSESQTVKNQDQPEPEPPGTNNGAAAIPENQEDPNQHQPEPEPRGTTTEAEMPKNTSERQTEVGPDQTPAEPTDPSSEAATSSESQTVKNQDQPEPEPRGTTTETAIPENQEDPNQDQPEPEPRGTTTEAEMPNSTSEHQNEAGPDQTPAESTDPSSEAETSAEAPNAEKPPDHHHQQEDETTEE